MKTKDVKKLSPEERFLYWIRERENIRLRKEAGKPKPWTDDEILSSYRFCNVRRMDDKVSKWLLENWYEPFRDHPNMLPACALARFINLPGSLQDITNYVFREVDPAWGSIRHALRQRKKEGCNIFNGAYMVRGNDGMDKVECVVDYYVRPLVDNGIQVDTSSMEATWENILSSYGMGSFMAGQIVADLRWALSGEWVDRMDWAPKGPGSQRGLNRLEGEPLKRNLKQEVFLEKLQGVIQLVKDNLELAFPDLLSRLEAHDYQNCLCEFDKFERALWDEGRPKALYPGRE